MTTTLTIDDDILAAAEDIAASKNKSVGEVISELSRQALFPALPLFTIVDGIPILNTRKPMRITMEMVQALDEQLP